MSGTSPQQETSNPSAATIHGQLDNLYMFEYGCSAGAEDWHSGTEELLRELDDNEHDAYSQLFQKTMASCSAKLQAVMERHPSMDLFKALPVFYQAIGWSKKEHSGLCPGGPCPYPCVS